MIQEDLQFESSPKQRKLRSRKQCFFYFLLIYALLLLPLCNHAYKRVQSRITATRASQFPKVPQQLQQTVQPKQQQILTINGYNKTTVQIGRQYINNGLNQPSKQLIKKQKDYFEAKYNFSRITEQLPLCVVVLAFEDVQNQRYKFALKSIFRQQYSNYRVIYIDDGSKDKTGQYVQKFVKEEAPYPDKFKIIINKYNKNGMANQYEAGLLCGQDQIFINGPDGDDGLPGTEIFKLYNYYFQTYDAWLIWGQYMHVSSGITGASRSIDKQQIEKRQIRDYKYLFISHLKAFYNKIWRKVKKEDLLDEEGNFFKSARDLATVYPIVQMSGMHVKFIPQVTYIYLDFYKNSQSTTLMDSITKTNTQVRKKQKYPRLQCLFTNQNGECQKASQHILKKQRADKVRQNKN